MKQLFAFISLLLFAAILAVPARTLPATEIGRGVQLTWLGQSGFKIVSPKGTVILIDPWARGNTLYPFKNAEGNPDLTPLFGADIVLVTHGHFDHLGDTLEIAKESTNKEIKVVSIFELMTYLWQEGADRAKLQPMNIGGAIKIKDVEITMLRAVHSSGIGPFSPKSMTYGGEAAGYLIEFSNGFKIYDAGDTALFGEMKSYNTFYHPNLFLV
ncbi:MAG TPA: MBL fold metallo-hydrolase, partial [Nitrospiria bacterium]|nr:MBL fold metallo-hydrolase [Nitrospiria bacterium]